MPDRIIEAQAIISAKDNTGDVFTKIAGKFQQLGKGAKVSADIERMSKTIEQANSQLRALDKLQSTRTGFSDARARFQAQKVAVEQAAKAMKDAEKPTRALEQAYQRAQAEVSKSAAAFERSKTAMLDAKHAAEGFGTPLAKVAAEQARLRSVIDGTTRAIEHQANAEIRAAAAHAKAEKAAERRAHGIAHHGIVNYAAGAAAGYVGAHSVVTGIEHTLKAGADNQQALLALQNAGRTPAQIAAIQARSAEVVGRLPTSTYTDNLRVIGETTQAFGSVEHAMDNLEFMQKTMSVLHAAAGDKIKGGAGEIGQSFARFFEERQTRPEDFRKEAAAMIPAMVASGGVFNPDQMFAFAQQAKSALPGYNMRFLSGIAPSLIASQGGERAGTAANAFDAVISGKAHDKKQAAEWMRLGLLDPSQLVGGAGSPISWKSGAVKGTSLANQDPLSWAEQVLIPAMTKAGIDTGDRQSVKNELATLFRNQNANLFANEITQEQSRNRLHKDEALNHQVGDLDSVYDRNLKSDPSVGLQAFNASLENLMTTVSGPAMGAISTGLSGIASGVDALANALKDHPLLAMTAGAATGAAALGGAGYASYQLMNGFGLGTSASALDMSAAALDGAAAALDGAAANMAMKSTVGGVGGAVENGLAGGAKGGAVGEVVRDGVKAAGAVGTLAAGALMTVGAAVAVGSIVAMGEHAKTTGRLRLHAYQNRPPLGDVFGPGVQMPMIVGPPPVPDPAGHGAAGRYEAPSLVKTSLPGHWVTGRGGVREWVVDKSPEPFRGTAPLFARGIDSGMSAPMGLISDHPAGRVPSLVGAPALSGATPFPSGPIEATVKPDQITAKIEGQATVVIRVDGPGQVTGTYSSGNIRASTGGSVPSAKTASNGGWHGPH